MCSAMARLTPTSRILALVNVQRDRWSWSSGIVSDWFTGRIVRDQQDTGGDHQRRHHHHRALHTPVPDTDAHC